jgi:hypothetical protein
VTLPEQSDTLVAFIDGRCGCDKCEERAQDVYRMVGHCMNCGARPILILYRSGANAADKDCPICGGYWRVHPDRLATADEIPAAVECRS